MTLLRRFVPVALAALFGGAVACGGDSMGPKVGSITGMFGDNDSVFTGGTLSIGFTVLDGQGYPLKGAKVSWTVAPSTAATISPTTQTSDSIGNVATLVQAGSAVAAFTVTASLNGVAPIDFHLKAIDPCHYVAALTLGDTVSGALRRTDCKVSIGSAFYFYDYYKLTLPAGQNSIRINMSSTMFDTYVDLYGATGQLIGFNDDIKPGIIQNSQLDIILGQGGDFIIGANSYDPDTVGAYTLSARSRPTTLSGCQDAWMTPGAIITDTIRSTDCADSLKNYSDIIYMFMQASEVIRVAERSSVVNPRLTLYNANFTTQRFDSVAANDDSASGNPNAYIAYTVPANGWYLLKIGTATPADTGEYTLAFDANTGPTAPRSRGAARVLRVLPSGTFRGWKKHS